RYRDYIALERASLKSDECRQYWGEKLREQEPGRLPRVKKERGEGQARRVKRRLVRIGEEEFERLKKVAREAGGGIKSVLLSGHLKVLSRLVGEEGVVTGIVTNGRPETKDGERVVGLFLNTLPLSMRLKGGSWIELAREVFEAEREMMRYRRYPLIEIQ